MVYRYSMVAARMTENSEFGDYVLYSDYATLQAKLTEVEEKINILQGAYEKEQVKRMAAEERERVLRDAIDNISEYASMIPLHYDEHTDPILSIFKNE